MSSNKAKADAVPVKQLWAEIAKCEASRDYERSVKALNRILKQYPDDLTAIQCKVVAFIQLGRFEDSLILIKKHSEVGSGFLAFEQAYCLYRLNRSTEALKVLESAESNDAACQELKAQLLYRLERYEDCLELYKSLLRITHDEFDVERETNLVAVLAQLGRLDQYSSIDVGKSYELCFNQGCRLLTAGQTSDALRTLDRAEDLCKENPDEMDEEDLAEELSVILCQKAYALQNLGRQDEAIKIYQNIVKEKPDDVAVLAVASNNFVSIKGAQNVWDSRKKMKTCSSKDLTQKLNSKQQFGISLNNALLNLYSNQLEQCRSSAVEMKKSFKKDETCALLQASVLVREKKNGQAVKTLLEFMKEKRDYSPKVPLAIAQLYLLDGKLKQAVEMLRSLELVPSLLLACAAGYVALGDKPSAIKLLQDVLTQNRGNDTVLSRTAHEELAKIYIADGNYPSATKHLEELRRLAPNDWAILAKLIKAYSQYDVSKAEELIHVCGAGMEKEMTADVDVEQLESSSWMALGAKYTARKTKQAKEEELSEEVTKKKRKKNRKPKLPKNFDPNVAPDPERWLPRYERSTFKKRKDKRAREKEITRGTQGLAGGGGATDLDASEKATPSPGNSTPSSPLVQRDSAGPGPRQQRPGQQKPKKTKKKGKW